MTPTPEQIAALAEGLHRELELLCLDAGSDNDTPTHDMAPEWWAARAASILAHLDGWTLVPTAERLRAVGSSCPCTCCSGRCRWSTAYCTGGCGCTITADAPGDAR